MAFLSGTYTGANDALNQLASFAVANGWTQNLLADDSSKYTGDAFTGRRLHLQKTINGVVTYCNFRSANNQGIFEASTPSIYYSYRYYPVTGIGVNISTGFDASASWDTQPGYITGTGPSMAGLSTGGSARGITDAGGSFSFISDPTGDTLSAIFYDLSNTDSTAKISVGVTGLGFPVYITSGGKGGLNETYANYTYATWYDNGSGVRGSNDNVGVLASGVPYTSEAQTASGGNISMLFRVPFTSASNIRKGLAGPYVYFSPDPFRGNLPPAPVEFYTTGGSYAPSPNASLGVVDGVFMINRKNYAEGASVFIGSEAFKVFNIGNGEADNAGILLRV